MHKIDILGLHTQSVSFFLQEIYGYCYSCSRKPYCKRLLYKKNSKIVFGLWFMGDDLIIIFDVI